MQPSQGDVRRLHRLPYHPYQLAIQRIKVSLLTQLHGEAGEVGEPTSGLEPLTCSLRVIEPNPAIRSRSLRPGLLAGSRIRRTAYISRPLTTNLSATIESGGMERAANLVAA